MSYKRKFKISQIARDDAEENEEERAQARFAPEIYSGEEPSGRSLPLEDDLQVSALPPDGRVERVVLPESSPEDAGKTPANGENSAYEENSGANDDFCGADGDNGGVNDENAVGDRSFGDHPAKDEDFAALDDAGSKAPDGDAEARAVFSDNGGEAPPEKGPAEEEPDDAVSPEDAEAHALFVELCDLPARSRVFGLYGKDLLLSCPDGRGGVYLFEKNGDYTVVSPGECAAFIRVCAAEGCFRNKRCRTGDVAYLLDEQMFPLSFLARNKEQYDLAAEDGYLPCGNATAGKGVRMIKPVSLYRMKDLSLRVEYADGRNFRDSEQYNLDIDRSFLDGPGGSVQLARVGRACAEAIAAVSQPFFTVQILKVRKNLVVCFPMDGIPSVGDRLADERITDMAPVGDGSFVLKLGCDESFSPDLSEGSNARGQRRISLVK